MDYDDLNETELARHFLGDVTVDLLSELARRVKAEVSDDIVREVEENISNLQPHEMAALTLGQILGQLAIKYDDRRLFHGSVACMWFSGAVTGLVMPPDISELMDFADEIWDEAQKDISDILSDSVGKIISDS